MQHLVGRQRVRYNREARQTLHQRPKLTLLADRAKVSEEVESLSPKTIWRWQSGLQKGQGPNRRETFEMEGKMKWFELENQVIGTGHEVKVLCIGYTLESCGGTYQQTP